MIGVRLIRILVCGGREFGDLAEYREEQHHEPDSWVVRKKEKEYGFIWDSLEVVAKNYSENFNPDDNWLPSDITIISGMATGVDSVAADWAACNWCQLLRFPISDEDWKIHGKKAGYLRNQRMLDEGKPDLVVAFPGGRGTTMMIKLAEKAGIPVLVYSTTGT